MPTFSISKKLFITFFLLMMGVAFYVSCINFSERTKFSPTKTVRHYNGDEEDFNNESNYEYNDESLKEGFFFPKSYREILEITHVHAFMIPLIIFVMSRILSMTKIKEGAKITVYSSAFAGTIMNLSSPLLIRFKSDIFTISLIASYLILGLCFIAFISLPIYEMWFKNDSGRDVKDTDYWL